jgi:phosphatidylserine decarboxylase
VSTSFESALLSVWQQGLVDKKKIVEIDGQTYSVKQTAKSKLQQIDFRIEGRELRGLEQNPNTKSRWAKLAREGKKVMQFLEAGRYIAVVADGKIQVYK